jgi:hypothetical protein
MVRRISSTACWASRYSRSGRDSIPASYRIGKPAQIALAQVYSHVIRVLTFGVRFFHDERGTPT